MDMKNLSDIFTKIRLGVTIIGLVGNIAVFLIFSRKRFQTYSINIYCRALAISDSIIILVQTINDIGNVFFNISLYSYAAITCKLSTYVYIGGPPISSWILAAFSVDKTIHILFPNKFAIIKKRSFQVSVIAFILILNALIYMIAPLKAESIKIPGPNSTILAAYCQITDPSYYKALEILFLIESCLVPFLIMFASSCIIVKTLVSSRRRLEAHENREMRERRLKDLKFSLNSIVIDILNVVFQIPFSVTFAITFPNQNVFILYYLIAIFFYDLNFSIRFFTYLFSNHLFRNEILVVLGLRSQNVVAPFANKNII